MAVSPKQVYGAPSHQADDCINPLRLPQVFIGNRATLQGGQATGHALGPGAFVDCWKVGRAASILLFAAAAPPFVCNTGSTGLHR
jgi:hypothetical protein